MRLNFDAGRPPLRVAQERGAIHIEQDRQRIRLTDDEAVRVSDALIDLVESRA